MSNTSLASRAFKPDSPSLPAPVLRDLFQATPLYIFSQALKAAFAPQRQH
jgi:hypothetical protein